MAADLSSSHVDAEELAQLALDELPLEREEYVLSHIAECDACAELAAYLRDMSEALDDLNPAQNPDRVRSTTDTPSQEKNAIRWRDRLSGALADLRARGLDALQGINERLAALVRAPETLATAAVEILWEATGEARIFAESAKSCVSSGAMDFAYALADEPERGESAPVSLTNEGAFVTSTAVGYVAVDSENRRVTVELSPREPGPDARLSGNPVILLVPETPGTPAIIGESQPSGKGITVVFKNVPDSFLVAVFLDPA